jgi:hypothetical protein
MKYYKDMQKKQRGWFGWRKGGNSKVVDGKDL